MMAVMVMMLMRVVMIARQIWKISCQVMGGLQPPVVLLKTTDIQAAFDRKDASHQELVLVPEMSVGIPRIKQDGSHQARLPPNM